MALVPAPGASRAEMRELLESMGLDSIDPRTEVITPETAALWLTYNELNRSMILNNTAQLARDMEEGRYLTTGQPIIFGESGRLLNGQHTLTACVQSGVAIVCVVVRGIKNEDAVMGVLDSGKKRTLAHALKIAGESSAARVAATINLAWRYETHRLVGIAWPSHAEGLDYLDQHPEVRDVVLLVDTVYRQMKVHPSAASVALLFNARVDAARAEEFWRMTGSGEGLRRGDPILALRRYMIQAFGRREKPDGDHWLRVHLKAMNLWRDGRSIQILVVKPGETPEPWEGWDAT